MVRQLMVVWLYTPNNFQDLSVTLFLTHTSLSSITLFLLDLHKKAVIRAGDDDIKTPRLIVEAFYRLLSARHTVRFNTVDFLPDILTNPQIYLRRQNPTACTWLKGRIHTASSPPTPGLRDTELENVYITSKL